MKEVLKRLKETIEIPENVIQFRIGDQFYELEKLRNGEWIAFTVFGDELKLNTKKLKGLDRAQVEEILTTKFKNVDIY